MRQYDENDEMQLDAECALESTTLYLEEDDLVGGRPHTATDTERSVSEAEIERVLAKYPLKLTKEECLAMQDDPKRHCEWYGLRLDSHDDERKVGQFLHSKTEQNPWDIAEGKATCNRCGGSEVASYLMYSPRTNLYWKSHEECKCRKYKFAQRLLRAKLSPILQELRLSNLKPYPPSPVPPARQKEEIQFIKDNINHGFMWYGKPGTSKSTMAACVLRTAIAANSDALYKSGIYVVEHKLPSFIGIWNIDGNRLFESEVEYATSNDKANCKRLVTVNDIEDAKSRGIRPFLLIEELDKRRMTEFAANVLFKLVDAMDRTEGQLVITTNLTPRQFEEMFSKSNDVNVRTTGEALLRRIKKLCEQRNLFE